MLQKAHINCSAFDTVDSDKSVFKIWKIPELAGNCPLQLLWRGYIQTWSTILQSSIALTPNTKFHSNRTDSLGEEDVNLSITKIEDAPLAPLTVSQSPCRAFRHATEAPTLNSLHLAGTSWQKDFWIKSQTWGLLAPAHLEGTDPDGEFNLTKPHCPDGSHKLWFESAR